MHITPEAATKVQYSDPSDGSVSWVAGITAVGEIATADIGTLTFANSGFGGRTVRMEFTGQCRAYRTGGGGLERPTIQLVVTMASPTSGAPTRKIAWIWGQSGSEDNVSLTSSFDIIDGQTATMTMKATCEHLGATNTIGGSLNWLGAHMRATAIIL
jgi:hypothetical protein